MPKDVGKIYHLASFIQVIEADFIKASSMSPDLRSWQNEFLDLSDFTFYQAINRAAGQPQNFLLSIQFKITFSQMNRVSKLSNIFNLNILYVCNIQTNITLILTF